MEESIRIFFIVSFMIMGLSHLFQPAVWVGFFKMLLEKKLYGVFINGFITLPSGLLIISFHNVWSGIPMLLTIAGWMFTIKAAIIFLVPRLGLKSMKQVEKNKPSDFRVMGVVLCAAAIILSINELGI